MSSVSITVAVPPEAAKPAHDEDHEESHGHKDSAFKPYHQKIVQETNKDRGLTNEVYHQRVIEFGPNAIPEKKRSPILLFLSFFWGPMPCMIWAAIIIELVQAILTGNGWPDFSVLVALQFANAIVGFIEDFNAGNAVDALKQQLAPQAFACRDGVWSSVAARSLVPGDLIELKLGDIVPADAILLDGIPVQIDQAALTGESLPVTLGPGGHAKMGSALKRGHIRAVVVDTGGNTFFGKAATMINSVKHKGRLQTILLQITIILLVLCVLMCAAIFARLMTAPEPAGAMEDGGDSKVMRSLAVVVVILVASIPVAIEVVSTSTMAVGSHRLSAKKIIVARLSAIEELAGMTILCSDKTGTLTLNQLSLREPHIIAARNPEDVIMHAALASKRDGNQDAIDLCITKAMSPAQLAILDSYVEEDHVPFDPIAKRAVTLTRGPDGTRIKVAKGAPQIVLRMSHNKAEIEKEAHAAVADLASRGFRALGVAVCRNPIAPPAGSNDHAAEPQPGEKWEYDGILSLVDPPRPDTRKTIEAAIQNGVEVKMITGDQTAIAKETCRELGMGTNILNTEALDDKSLPQEAVDQIIMEAHGFAEVMPEHKFKIVERIREQGHVTGMTGDGVNDAPALKRADIGIAVHGATDAAKAAAAIVLTEPGLSVIIDAIFESRKIFQRMRNYIIYRISCTLQLLFFFFFGIICISADGSYMYQGQYPAVADREDAENPFAHAPHFTLPVISLVIITILNDGTMITISHDKVTPEKRPQRWAMFEVWVIAIVLGMVACFSSLILLSEGMHANVLNPDTVVGRLWGSSGRTYLLWGELKTIMYLKISVSDFLTLFSARSRTWFWERCLGKALGIAFLIATAASTLFALFWSDFITLHDARMSALRHSPGAVVATWIYCLLWFIVQDAAKVGTYWVLDKYWKSHEERIIEEHATAHHPANLPPKPLAEPAVEAAARAVMTAAEASVNKPPVPPTVLSNVVGTIGRAATAVATLGRASSHSTIGTAAGGGGASTGRNPAPSRRGAPSRPVLPDGTDLNAVLNTVRAATVSRGVGAGTGLNGHGRSLADVFPALRHPHGASETGALINPLGGSSGAAAGAGGGAPATGDADLGAIGVTVTEVASSSTGLSDSPK